MRPARRRSCTASDESNVRGVRVLFLLEYSPRAPHLALLWRRAVAQLGSALEWGSRGRGFESRRPDQLSFAFRVFQFVEFPEPRTMKFPLWSLAVVLWTMGAALAQEPGPTPGAEAPQTSPTPEEQSGETPTASPMASPTPESQESPQLLPESKTLPPQPVETLLPRDLIPEGAKPRIPGSIPNPTSAEQLEKDKIRFRQLRTIAVRDPYAVYFWRRSRSEHTDEMKREYLRVYYITMCEEMRKLEPRLKPMIDAFEASNLVRVSPVAARPTVPGRDIPRFEASQRRH
jgi:hypothetical protein